MSNQSQTDKQARAPHSRKPYVKPAYQREDVFETMALSCGKTGTQGQCHGNHKNS